MNKTVQAVIDLPIQHISQFNKCWYMKEEIIHLKIMYKNIKFYHFIGLNKHSSLHISEHYFSSRQQLLMVHIWDSAITIQKPLKHPTSS